MASAAFRKAPDKERAARKNLLLVSLDTLRKDSLGCYGYSRPTSPFLDSLAARGGRFGSVTSVAPYTLPTHATMLTGLFPSRHGAVHPVDRFVADRVEYLPRVLRRFGYHTAAFVGGGYVSDAFGFDAGFDRFSLADPLRVEDDDLAAAEPGMAEFRKLYNLDGAASWVESRQGEPWFLMLHTFMVHEYKAPRADVAKFDSQPETTPGRVFPDYVVKDEWRTHPPSSGDTKKLRDLYDATIHYADRSLAAFLARLEASGALENTLIVITSDHGEEFFEHESLRHSVTLYEEMIQVPWIVTGPGIPAGHVVKEPVSQADLFPTMLDLLDIPVPEGLDGHSRAAILRGASVDFMETPLFSQVASPHSRRTALRLGPWKTIRSETALKPLTNLQTVPLELFDLRNDPTEISNLASPDSPDFKRMQSALQSVEKYLQALAIGREDAAVDPELVERLRQLGYVR
jgi:arylsulfatase A-like enzyme